MIVCETIHYDDVKRLMIESNQWKSYMEFQLIALLLPYSGWVFIMDDSKEALITYTALDPWKANVHICSTKEMRGKRLKDFMVSASKFVLEEYGFTSLINFVDEENKALMYFMNKLGAIRVGTVEHGKGESNQIMYCSSLDNLGRI